MAKKTSITKTQPTATDVSRMQSAVAKKHGGMLPKDSYVSGMQRRLVASTADSKSRQTKLQQEPAMQSHHDQNRRANQLNPNNDEYWRSRGLKQRPDNWMELI